MALLFLDSFDHYSDVQGSRKWTIWRDANITAGRTGNGVALNAGGPANTLSAEYPTMTLGEAYRDRGVNAKMIYFQNAPAQISASLSGIGDGRLRVTVANGHASYSYTITTFVMNIDIWYYVEFSCTIVSVVVTVSGGTTYVTVTYAWEVRINEATINTGSVSVTTPDYDTGAFPGVGWPTFGIEGVIALVDDLYVTDGELLGDIKIQVLYPNAPGTTTMGTPTPAVANWNNVKEHPSDDDTSYNSFAAVNDLDLYNLDDVGPFVGDIKGVQALWLTKKSDAGAGAIKGVWRSAGTQIDQTHGHNYIAPDGFHPSDLSYSYALQAERKSLFTAADWTVSEINALEIGVKRTV